MGSKVAAVAVGAAVVVAGVVGAGSGAAAAPPAQDAFYQPPVPVPGGAFGDVLRARGAAYPMSSAVKSTQVLYRTQNATGQTIAVSGTVLVPTKAWNGTGSRPLVSYAVGTRGLGDACAPSYTLTQGLDYEQFTINDLLNKGWAVAVSDMEGLGTPGVHTYIVGRSEGRAVLDIARAAQRLPGTGLDPAGPVGIVGHSQGGSSAGWAAELAATYAPELNLKGVSASGVPADPIAMGKFLDGGLGAGLMFMASLGFDAAYPELGLDGYLNDAGRKIRDQQKDICLASVNGIPAIASTAFKRISDFTTRSPLDAPDWQARFNENKLGSVRPSVPVFQGHGMADQLVGYTQGDALHKSWCALGADLTWKAYPLAEHLLGFLVSWPDATAFLTDRFAGKPVKRSC
ncbi:lipase family protein [Actinocorallia lasiicapitis]